MTRSGALFQHPIAERPINATAYGLWATPKIQDHKGLLDQGTTSKGCRKSPLPVQMRTWPTPVASCAKGSSLAALTRKSGASRENDRLDHAVMALHNGQLNPEWVEWLMGWPIGWTGLKPLEMDKFLEWQRQHSPCSPLTITDAMKATHTTEAA
jgi:hypothetical protein